MDYLRVNESISKDEIIINLIHILWENRMMHQADIVDDITEDADFVDDKLDAILDEISKIKQQVNELNHLSDEVKASLKEASKRAERRYNSQKADITSLKNEIKSKAKEIVEGVKRKGISELKKVSDFFKLREKFVILRDSVSKGIDDTNKTMTKIETFGQSVINVIKKPWAWQKKIYQKIENKLSNIIKKIEKLDAVTEEENKHVGQKNELEETADISEYSEDLKYEVQQNSNTENRINLGENLKDERIRELVQGELRFAVSESDNYKNLLHVMSRFHEYSFNNLVLIRSQMPEATLLAGRSAWHKEYGRRVNEGENGIKILAPIIERDENNIERFDGRYRVVELFDVSQTSGKQVWHL